MVSHYVVSWIQVIGLIVGLFGLFYLSLGAVGKTGGLRLRSLLPATAAALTFAFVVRPFVSRLASIILPHLSPPWAHMLASPYFIPVASFVSAVVAFVDTYQSTFLRLRALSQVQEEPQHTDRLSLRAFPLWLFAIPVVLGVVAALTGGTLLFVPGLPSTIIVVMTFLLLIALFGLTMAAIITTEVLIMTLPEQRLLTIGFFASVLAVSTQFIPPLLDILNIPVGK